MEKKKLMPVSLLILFFCIGFQVCSCGTSRDKENKEEPQSLQRASTSGQGATWPPFNQASLEERPEGQPSNITSTEEVEIRGQRRKKTSGKRRLKQLENGEMRGGKFPKVSNGTTDNSGQYNGISSSQGPTLEETPVPERASCDGQRDKRRGVQESCGKDDRAAESLGASPRKCSFVHESTRSDFAPTFHPGFSMCSAQRHVLSDGNSAVVDDQRFRNHNFNLESNSSKFGSREPVEGSRAANCLIVVRCDFTHPFTVSVTIVTHHSTETGPSESLVWANSSSVRRRAVEMYSTPVSQYREEITKRIKERDQLIEEERESKKQEKEGESEKDDEMESQREERWLCNHYNRRCEVRFPCCTQFYPCHRCHNSASNCKNDEAKECHATHLKCSLCQFEQEIDENSGVCSGCRVKLAEYFCFTCKSFRGVHKNPFHCDLCGICRIHEDEMYHCEGCNVCVKKKLRNAHKCLPNSDHVVQCPICLEDVVTGKGCHIWRCGHKAHRKCAVHYILSGLTTCPNCRQPLPLFNR